ncbi:hypothetical protein AB0O34_08510 [Sphaerisporangium sp. NPDC088356]|uniref:hypothetical protein n=1 Tax=Sphaerisporangium sp. NPDC088356 TaxID=3154871 RepID=UPI0034360EFA
MLAVQITVTALGSAGPASAATPNRLGATAHGAMPHEAHRRPGSPAEARAQRLRAVSVTMAARPRTVDARRLRQATAQQARAAGMVSAVLWKQHRLYRAVRLQHPQAARRLHHAGLRWRSSGHCANRHRHSCTSLSAVRLGTLWGLVNLKRRSGCPVVMTGGTEVGHARGAHSHGQGYKIDIEHNKCVDRFIRNRRMGRVRGDGARLFYERRPQGYTVYANEPSHWDIMFL